MSQRGKKASELPDRQGKGYFLLPDCLTTSIAWREASPLMVKLLIAICVRHNGRNNGRIGLSSRDAAKELGMQNYHSIAAAFAEAMLKGFIALEKDHPRGERMAREYRLTFVGVRDGPATNDYLTWRPGDAGTRKKRVAPTAAEISVSDVVTGADAKLSVVATAAETAKSAERGNVSDENASTHIFNHRERFSDRTQLGSVPHSHNDGQGTVVLTAAPSCEELRTRVADHVRRFGRGSQSRLAKLAGIPPGTFSRFINHRAPLNHQARLRLTLAFPRAELESRNLGEVSAHRATRSYSKTFATIRI
jgi:hypothetical protein